MKKLAALMIFAVAAVSGRAIAETKTENALPVVEITTSMGLITVQLNPAKAPITVENFLQYVDDQYYDGTVFHRVIKGFMVQGGGFDETLKKKDTRPPIKLESQNGLGNKRGTIAMARTNQKNSATSQFFINHVDNANLDSYGGGYAVFGKVIAGMDVVDKIAKVKTGVKKGMRDVPVETVFIQSIRRKAAK